MVHYIPNEKIWSEVNVDEVMRPKVLRRTEPIEPIREKRSCILSCRVCKALRHNKRSCLTIPNNKKKGKRP